MEEEKKSGVFTLPDGRKIEVSKEDLEHIFKGMRPRLMDYDDFRFVRSELNRELNRYKKGHLIHLSKVNDKVWEDYTKDKEIKPRQKGHTYVKKNEETR